MVCIETITRIGAPRDCCFDLARDVEVHLKGNVHFGEQAIATGGVTSGLIGIGQSVTWRAKHFFRWHNLTSQITAFKPPAYFQDTMLDGPFAFMQHDHYFTAVSPYKTEMRDVFRVAAPLGILGRVAEIFFLRRYMLALLLERNAVLKEVAEAGVRL